MKRKLQNNRDSLYAIIPKGITEHFGLEAGDKIDFRIEKDHIKAIPVHPSCKTDAQAAQHPAISEGDGDE